MLSGGKSTKSYINVMQPSNEKNPIRVRIAPSPTGHMHVGTARTALFNWLFAKKYGGKFILRIEDTDMVRSKKEYENEIIVGLEWLGLTFDEGPNTNGQYGPYRQSERTEIYEQYIEKLLNEKLAYYCDCSEEILEKERDSMRKSGEAPKYKGTCKSKQLTSGAVIRFAMPEGQITVRDIIRRDITFDLRLIGDIVIAKDKKNPLYNFAVVIDDALMEISHVIRGEEHLANTPRQLALQEALGFKTPIYAHLPLLLNAERAKLSKRTGNAVALNDFRASGFLPEAIVNFLVLLGWHPQGDKEILNFEEMIKEFSLERIQKGGAIFDVEKLQWLNAQYIKQKSDEQLLMLLKQNEKIALLLNSRSINQQQKIVHLVKERLQTLNDFEDMASYILRIGEYDAPLLIWKNEGVEITKTNLRKIHEAITKLSEQNFENIQTLEASVKPEIEKYGRGSILHPLRVALSGLASSAGPYELLTVLGKEEAIRRIEVAIDKL